MSACFIVIASDEDIHARTPPTDRSAVIAPAGSVTADNSGHVYGAQEIGEGCKASTRFRDNDTLLGTTGVGLHPFIPHLASDESGEVYVIWLRYITPSTRHIYGNASFDYGTTWEGWTDAPVHQRIRSCQPLIEY